jgi:hypothetical protein
MKITVFLIIILSTITNAQRTQAFIVNVGVSYNPMFTITNTPLLAESLIPSVDVLLKIGHTGLRISLSSVSRIGIHISSSFGLTVGFNYLYNSQATQSLRHAVEFEAGMSFAVGKDKDYYFTISSRVGVTIEQSRLYFCPVSIGLFKIIK